MPILIPAPSTGTDPTLSDLVDEVLANLQGFARDQELSTHLTVAVSETATSLTVADNTRVNPGLVQVDDELVWVDSVDTNTSAAAVPPYGRGFQGSTAATHESGAQVVSNPRFPRARVKRAINDTIKAIGKDIRAISVDDFTVAAGVYGYELPAGTVRVVEAMAANTDAVDKIWTPLDRFDVDLQADTTEFPSGAAFQMFNPVPVGYTVRVVCEVNPEILTANSDPFSETTGLDDQLVDVVVMGAIYRLAPTGDLAVLDYRSAESQAYDEQRPAGSAMQAGRYFYSMYKERLDEEISRYRTKFKPRLRRTR